MSFNNWNAIADALEKTRDQVIRKTAFDAQGEIQAEITNQGLIDTGFMKGVIYVVTSKESTYGDGPPPPKGAYLLPSVPKPDDTTTAYVAAGANYTIFLNNGTHLIPAHGFFEKGIDRVRPGFDKSMELIHQKMAEAGR